LGEKLKIYKKLVELWIGKPYWVYQFYRPRLDIYLKYVNN